MNSAYDVLVAGTAAHVALKSVTDFGVARVCIRAKEFVGGHDHPGSTKSTLQAMFVPKAFLERMQCVSVGESFNRCYVRTVGLNRQCGARFSRDAVEQNGAGATLTGVTPNFCAGKCP